MAKSLLVLLSFVLSLFIPTYGNALAIDTTSLTKETSIAIFPEKAGKYLYRAKIEFKENTYTGLMLIKKSADTSYRIAFVNELGLKIFEMEFFPNKEKSFVLHSCLSYLNKKVIINTLRRDLESLFLTFSAWQEPKIKQDGKLFTYQYKYEGKRTYHCNNVNDVFYIIRKRFGIVKEVIKIKNIKNPYPYEINIQHQHQDLSITLTFIK